MFEDSESSDRLIHMSVCYSAADFHVHGLNTLQIINIWTSNTGVRDGAAGGADGSRWRLQDDGSHL